MKILFISNLFPPGDFGGAEVAAFYSAYGLLQRGQTCSVLTIHARGDKDSEYARVFYGVPVKYVTYARLFPFQGLKVFDPRIYCRIVREIEQFRPDLVHVHNVSGTSLAPFVACRRMGIPVVLTLHDHWLLCPCNMLYRRDGTLCDPATSAIPCGQCYRRYDYWGDIPLRRQVFAALVSNVHLFISPSQKLVDLHVAAGYARERFRVLKNGFNLDIFGGEDTQRSLPPNGEAGTAIVLFSGVIVETKGIDTLVNALPLLERYVAGFRLLVAGSGDPTFEHKLRRYEPTSVRLLGKLPFYTLKELYRSVDLTVVPSIWYDNSPVVISESLLSGTPVLGSAIGGIPEVIPKEVGYLIPPRDALALAEQVILHFARSARERRTMRQRCIEYAQTYLTLDRHLDGLLTIYREAVE